MNRIANRFRFRVDAKSASTPEPDISAEEREAAVLDMVRRAPRTVQQVSEALRIAPTEGRRHLTRLCQDRLIERWRAGGRVIFRAVSNLPRIRMPGRPNA